jgi:hypothetical protein
VHWFTSGDAYQAHGCDAIGAAELNIVAGVRHRAVQAEGGTQLWESAAVAVHAAPGTVDDFVGGLQRYVW